MRILITRRERLNIPDGINTSIFNLGLALADLGHQVSYLSSYPCDIEQVQQFYDIQHFEMRGLFKRSTTFPVHLTTLLGKWALSGRKAVRQLRPDFIVHNGAIPIRLSEAPQVFVAHDLELRMVRSVRLQNFIKKRSYSLGFSLVATTSEIKEGVVNQLDCPARRIAVIPTCINLRAYKHNKRQNRRPAILHVGTEQYKNPLLTLEAYQMLLTDRVDLFFIGEPNKDLLDAIRSLTRRKTGNGIHLLGRVGDEAFRNLLAEVLVVSIPSVYASPVASPTVMEALASGTPVVTTPSISRDIAIDGVNCFVRKPTAEAFAEAIDHLLGDSSAWEGISTGALTIATKYDSGAVARQYLDLYEARDRKQAWE